MPDGDLIAELFAEADYLRAQADSIKDKQHDNRDTLRAFQRAEKLSPEQETQLIAFYPPRKKRGENQEN